MTQTITPPKPIHPAADSARRRARDVRRALAVEAAYLRELSTKAPLTNRSAPAFPC
jgi:hypothetical protein